MTDHNPDAFDDEFDADDTGEAQAAEGSTLASLRARRDKVRESLHHDLVVPRYDPPIYVRFRPVDSKEVTAATRRAQKSRDEEIEVIVNAGVLAQACIGIFEVVDGEEVSIDPTDRDGTWPQFDKRLARLLEVKADKAAAVVRSLYLTDGDIIATAGKLVEWSGFANAQLERDPEGN